MTDAEPERAATFPRGGGDGPTGARPRVPELVVFVGLQASGKSTFFRERFAATHEHVSKDLFPNNRNRNRRQARLVGEALAAGTSVIVDNTNPTVEERRALLELGRRHGARVVGYYFGSEVRRCVERNRRRGGRRGFRTWPYTRRPRGSCPPPSRRVSTICSACASPTTTPSRSDGAPKTGPEPGAERTSGTIRWVLRLGHHEPLASARSSSGFFLAQASASSPEMRLRPPGRLGAASICARRSPASAIRSTRRRPIASQTSRCDSSPARFVSS